MQANHNFTIIFFCSHNFHLTEKIKKAKSSQVLSHFPFFIKNLFSPIHRRSLKLGANSWWIRQLYLLLSFCLQVLGSKSSQTQLSQSSFIHGSCTISLLQALLSQANHSTHLLNQSPTSVSAFRVDSRNGIATAIKKVKFRLSPFDKLYCGYCRL